MDFTNQERLHQALEYRSPAEVYLDEQEGRVAATQEAGLPSEVMIPSPSAGDCLDDGVHPRTFYPVGAIGQSHRRLQYFVRTEKGTFLDPGFSPFSY